jgi:quinol monooxygenase YgiN
LPDRTIRALKEKEKKTVAYLTIVARIEAKKNCADLLESELRKLIEPTRKEAGCLQYDLHQDNENPAVFLFYETWKNRELWQAHMNSAHLSAFMKATEGALASLTVSEMTKI